MGNHQKSKGFSLLGILKTLGKDRKTHKRKQALGKFENEKNKGETKNGDRGNRTESLWEANLPLRGSLRWRFSDFFDSSEALRGFERFLEGFLRLSEVLEVFRDFPEVFRGPLKDPLEADFPLRGSQCCCPKSCCPLDFPPKKLGKRRVKVLGGRFGFTFIFCVLGG